MKLKSALRVAVPTRYLPLVVLDQGWSRLLRTLVNEWRWLGCFVFHQRETAFVGQRVGRHVFVRLPGLYLRQVIALGYVGHILKWVFGPVKLSLLPLMILLSETLFCFREQGACGGCAHFGGSG
jgi:hypothetical protein